MKHYIDIRKYKKEKFYKLNLCGFEKICPLYKVTPGMWVVGNDHLSFGADVEFTRKIGKRLSKELSRFNPDYILTAETKSLGLAYEISRCLCRSNFAIARKDIRSYRGNGISSEIKSITSEKKEYLFLDEFNIKLIKGKRIVIFDDVISTCSTVLGLMKLAEKAGAKVCAIASVWVEGSWVFEIFRDFLKKGQLIYLGVLPIFANGNNYEELIDKKHYIEKNLKSIN